MKARTTYTSNVNYWSHPDVIATYNKVFYNNSMTIGPSDARVVPCARRFQYLIGSGEFGATFNICAGKTVEELPRAWAVDIRHENRYTTSGSRYNEGGAGAIGQFVARLTEPSNLQSIPGAILPSLILVLIPYNADLGCLKRSIQRMAERLNRPTLLEAQMATTDGYQGGAAEIVIFHPVTSREQPGYTSPGFLRDSGRLLVSLSRGAQRALDFIAKVSLAIEEQHRHGQCIKVHFAYNESTRRRL